jgi:hypothetical protein
VEIPEKHVCRVGPENSGKTVENSRKRRLERLVQKIPEMVEKSGKLRPKRKTKRFRVDSVDFCEIWSSSSLDS